MWVRAVLCWRPQLCLEYFQFSFLFIYKESCDMWVNYDKNISDWLFTSSQNYSRWFLFLIRYDTLLLKRYSQMSAINYYENYWCSSSLRVCLSLSFSLTLSSKPITVFFIATKSRWACKRYLQLIGDWCFQTWVDTTIGKITPIEASSIRYPLIYMQLTSI